MLKIDWSKVTWENFELLALDYAKNRYPEFDWMKTPKQGLNQDNHDMEAQVFGHQITQLGFSHEEIILNRHYQIWGEVKYSDAQNRRIGKQQLDQTIVSARIAGNVVFMLFITNKEFVTSYKIRAEQLLSEGTKFFDFIDKADIEAWLKRNSFFIQKYFQTNYLQDCSPTPTFELKEACFFDFNDLKNRYYTLIKSLKLNKEYILFISIKSNINDSVLIINERSFPFIIEPLDGFDYKGEKIAIHKGTNNIFLFIKPRRITRINELEFQLLDSKANIHTISYGVKAQINAFRNIEFVFTQQTIIIEKLSRLIKEETQSQLFSMIYAQAGSGKSKILEKLYLELGPHVEYLHVDFKDNENLNAKKLCELILFLNYGEIFQNLTADAINRFGTNLKFVDSFFANAIYNIAQTESDGAENRLYSVLRQNKYKCILNPKRLSKAKVVFCDDVHKVNGASALTLRLILNEIQKNELNLIIIMAAREHEFEDAILKNDINKIIPFPHRLNNPSSSDIKETLDTNFSNIGHLITKELLEDNNLKIIVWEQIMKDIDREINNYPKDRHSFVRHLTLQIKEVVQHRESFLKKIFIPFKKLWYLMDIIYGFRIGIEETILIKIAKIGGNKKGSMIQHIDMLLKENLIRKDRGKLFPWHDIYYQEYMLLKIHKATFNADLARFLQSYIKYKPQDQGYAISLILKCDIKDKITFVKIAEKIRDEYYNDTNFGAALDIAKSVTEFYHTNKAILNSDYELLSAKFKYADCVDHCGSIIESRKIFNEVYTTGIKQLGDPKIYGITLEAKAEVYNIDYWLLNVKEKLNDHREFINILEGDFEENKENKNFISAYLTAYNRLMTSLLLMDQYKEAQILFELNLSKADDLGRKEYVGFAHMDYAKGIYQLNIDDAYNNMEIAQKIFKQTNQQRRFLDCTCEINYLRQIRTNKSLIQLEKSSEDLRLKGLNNQYAKSLLKIVACLLVSGRGNEEKIKFLIEKAIKVNAQLINPRVDLICCNLFTAIKYKFENEKDVAIDIEKHLETTQKIGLSYANIATHNQQITKYEGVNWFDARIRNDENYILIDPRIW